MIEYIVIIGFLMSISFFLPIVKVYDLQQEIKALEKKKLNYQFKQCYNRGKMKAYQESIQIFKK